MDGQRFDALVKAFSRGADRRGVVAGLLSGALATLLAAGEAEALGRDPIARRPWCQHLAAAARQGTMAEIPGQGHVLQHTAPGAAAEAISGWVRALDGFGVTA